MEKAATQQSSLKELLVDKAKEKENWFGHRGTDKVKKSDPQWFGRLTDKQPNVK